MSGSRALEARGTRGRWAPLWGTASQSDVAAKGSGAWSLGRCMGWAAALGVVLASTLALAGCQQASQAAPGAPRLIVLGIDGMDWELTRRLIAEGRLPNLQRLATEGMGQPLGTSIPPLSPVAWSDFITGMDAGGHGIFDFVHRDAATLQPFLSTSRTHDSDRSLKLGRWQFPFGGGGVELLRRGTAFWEPLAERGVHTTVLRMPANFPPSGTAHLELSGMGTPDVTGSYGTFSFFDSDPFAERRSVGGGEFYPLDYWDDVATGELRGPPNPFLRETTQLTHEFQLFVDAEEPVALLRIGNEERVLAAGEWTDWVPFSFEMVPRLGWVPGMGLPAMARFHLRSVRPEVELYVSPINFDPMDPALPISTPPKYATELAAVTGRFYTEGMPEDTEALKVDALTFDEFLEQSAIAHREIVEQWNPVLEDFESGLLFYYFGNIDQVSHMMWRALDPEHPAYDEAVDPRYADVIPRLYEDADALIGRTIERMGPDTTLVVMSDHGFASWRRAFNLNTWLEREGYLVLSGPPPAGRLSSLSRNVDWSKTRAYGLGLNGLYVNLAGRERDGIVPLEEKLPLLHEIAAKLGQVVDEESGEQVVQQTYISEESFEDRGYLDIGPDMVVGYARYYRASNETGIGEITPEMLSDNTSRWSGDHQSAPETVPGVLFANRRLGRPVASLQDLAGAILAELGVEEFPLLEEAGTK